MAQCKLTPREFIGNAFSPQIAVVCSVTADAACQKNNLSFVELLQPFCKLNTEGKANSQHSSRISSPLIFIFETTYALFMCIILCIALIIKSFFLVNTVALSVYLLEFKKKLQI